MGLTHKEHPTTPEQGKEREKVELPGKTKRDEKMILRKEHSRNEPSSETESSKPDSEQVRPAEKNKAA